MTAIYSGDLGEQACREDPQQCNQDGGLQQVEKAAAEGQVRTWGQARDATRYTLDALQMATGSVGLKRRPQDVRRAQ